MELIFGQLYGEGRKNWSQVRKEDDKTYVWNLSHCKTKPIYLCSKNKLYLQGTPFTQVFPFFPFICFRLIPIPTEGISGYADE